MKKVLFVSEKWTDGNPSLDLTNHFNNLFEPFKINYPEVLVDNIFLDECFYNGIHVDTKLDNYLINNNPDFIIISFLGQSHMNPSISYLNNLKNKNIIFIWPDTAYSFARESIKKLSKYFHVSWGGEEIPEIYDNHIYLFAPQNEKLFFPDKKNITISFIGSLNGYMERVKYLNYLNYINIPLVVSGGQRENKLSPERYAELIRKSIISLNFPESPSNFDQVKGRCFEILASESLMLSRKSKVYDKYFEEDKHYVSFLNEQDLSNKINYLLNNPEKITEISKNGYNLYLEKYSSKSFWNTVFLNFKK